MTPVVLLDPGHGDTPGARGYDPGVTDGGRHEAIVALEAALTCRFVLAKAGWDARLSRDGSAGPKPDLEGRVRLARAIDAVALVSLHYNSRGTYPLVYYAPGFASLGLARAIAREQRIPDQRVWPSSSARFGRLYVDSFPDERPAVLWELGPIESAPRSGERGRAGRLELAGMLERALRPLLVRAGE